MTDNNQNTTAQPQDQPSIMDLVRHEALNYARQVLPRWERYCVNTGTSFQTSARSVAFPDAVDAIKVALELIDLLLIENDDLIAAASNDGGGE